MKEVYRVYWFKFTNESRRHIMESDIETYDTAEEAIQSAKRAWGALDKYDQRRHNFFVLHEGIDNEPELWNSDNERG